MTLLFGAPSSAYPSRREFFAARDWRRPARARVAAPRHRGVDGGPALPGQGEVGHLAVHERRARARSIPGTTSPSWRSATARSCRGFDNKTGFFADQVGRLMKSPFKFAQHGQCGAWVSEMFPHLAGARRRHGVHPLVLRPSRTTTRRPCSRSTPA